MHQVLVSKATNQLMKQHYCEVFRHKNIVPMVHNYKQIGSNFKEMTLKATKRTASMADPDQTPPQRTKLGSHISKLDLQF